MNQLTVFLSLLQNMGQEPTYRVITLPLQTWPFSLDIV